MITDIIGITDLGDGVCLLAIRSPGPVTTLGSAVNAALAYAVGTALADASVTGLVITSTKADFGSGGDLDELRRCRTADEVLAIVTPFIGMLRRMETGGKPIVAALNGTALGGGLELALACHHRIAANHPRAIFGLPEASLGLMPGAGGTQRLPRLIGVKPAADLILKGRTVGVDEARQLGIIDAVVDPEQLVDAAKAWAIAHPAPQQPWDQRGYKLSDLDPQTSAGRQFFAMQWARIRSRSAGHDTAATAILHALHHGLQRDIEAGIAIESRHFAGIAASAAAHNRIRTGFYAPRATQAAAKALSDGIAGEIGRIGVIGGGVMGRGIAFGAARAGLKVTLLDASTTQADAAKLQIADLLARQIARGAMTAGSEPEFLGRITAGSEYALLADCDLVIEAVFERLDVKHQVLRAAAEATRADVPIASNTSTIPIGELAKAVMLPARVIGMHFFAPAERMPLLEVIRTRATSARTLGLALKLAGLLRKTPIVVKDGPGFFTSRIVSCYSGEALTMLAEGVPAPMIDNAAINMGMAIGPLALADLTKLDLLKDIMSSMADAGIAMRGIRGVEALTALLDAGRTGRPAGAGIHDYVDGEARAWPGLARLFPRREPPLELAAIQQRLFYAQSLDAARALAEGVLGSPGDGDVASVQGWGFPIHLGGVFSYMDYVGIDIFTRAASKLAKRHGERFTPPAMLKRMAREGGRFYPD